MKRKTLSILLVLIIPLLFFAGCKSEPENKINMSRYFSSCSYALKGSSDSITGEINSYLNANNKAMKKYETITLTGDTNWLYGMTLDYFTFDVYSNEDGEFQIQMEFTNLTKGTNELEQNPEKTLIETFQDEIKANTPKTIKISFKDGEVVKSISAETKLTFTFGTTPDTTYTITNFQLYGYHK